MKGGFTSYDVFALMGYQYLSAGFDGACRLPGKSYQAEVEAAWRPMERLLLEDPDAFRGQVIALKDGCNMARRTARPERTSSIRRRTVSQPKAIMASSPRVSVRSGRRALSWYATHQPMRRSLRASRPVRLSAAVSRKGARSRSSEAVTTLYPWSVSAASGRLGEDQPRGVFLPDCRADAVRAALTLRPAGREYTARRR